MQPHEDIECNLDGVVIIHHNKPMTHYDKHSHEYHECFIPLFGSLEFKWEEKSTTVGPGQMLTIPAGFEHEAHSPDKQGERLIILFESTVAAFDVPKFMAKSQLLTELCFHLLDESSPGRDEAVTLLKAVLRNTLMSEDTYTGKLDFTARVDDERVKKALAIMESSFKDELTMADVAKQSGFAERSMQRAFKSELSMSPKTVLTLYRIHHAKHLLQSGGSVTEVAFSVGYGSLSQFIAQFKAVTGQLPSTFQS